MVQSMVRLASAFAAEASFIEPEIDGHDRCPGGRSQA